MGNNSSNCSPSEEPKVILTTGASSGIGKASALSLIQRGHVVYCGARRVEQMKDIADLGGHVIRMDITQEEDSVKAVARIIQEQGRIDVLVNNAGTAVFGPMEMTSIQDAKYQFDVNFFGLARLTQQVIPHMREARSGTIVNMSSIGGRIYAPFESWYVASKHALEGWSDCLRLELNPFDIKVVVIQPGAIKTEIFNVLLEPMRDRARGTAYQPYVEGFAKGTQKLASTASDTDVISKIVVDISESSNPSRRYVAGSMAKPLFFVKNWCGDGVLDAMNLYSMKEGAKEEEAASVT